MHHSRSIRVLSPVLLPASLLAASVALLMGSTAAPTEVPPATRPAATKPAPAKSPRASLEPASSQSAPPALLTKSPGAKPTAPAPLAAGASATPNIVFVIIDDAGVDQFERWNPAGVELAKTPVVDSLCDQGVRFSNVWSMPQCSPSRVAMMTGRYPFRTGVMNACLQTAPPRSQASPYEFTLPSVRAKAGYASG